MFPKNKISELLKKLSSHNQSRLKRGHRTMATIVDLAVTLLLKTSLKTPVDGDDDDDDDGPPRYATVYIQK